MKKYPFAFLLLAVLFGCSSSRQRSDAYGNFEAEDVVISAEATGKLLKFEIDEGIYIEEGKLIGIIDTTDLVLKKLQLTSQKLKAASSLDHIEAQIAVLEQQKANLVVDKNRIENLLKDGAATQKQLDDISGSQNVVEKQILSVRSQKSAVMAELQAIAAQIEQVEFSISRCYLVNPIRGTVLNTYANENELTAFGKPLYKIADIREMILRVYISGTQLSQVRIGQEVDVIVDAGKGELMTLPGTVSWISSSAEFTPKIIQTREERVNLVYAVKVRVKNDGSLKIGMPGEINF